MSINANPHGIVYEEAKVSHHVGSHGPALINLHWPNSWPGAYWGNGLSGGAGNTHYTFSLGKLCKRMRNESRAEKETPFIASNTKRDAIECEF